MNHTPRRVFLKTAAGAAFAAPWVRGANDRINLGVVGLGGRGTDHLDNYMSLPGVRIVSVCDINQAARERGAARVKAETGQAPKEYSDMRQMFADKDVDAVSFATPNHWHALGAIWACQAGKDVYVEKPASHNIVESGKMVEAARKYNRIVQVGTQNRSNPTYQEAVATLRGGLIGKIYFAKGLCYKRRPSIGHKSDGPVPPGIDWDAFLGPAPMRPFNVNRYKYNWHWFWDTGNGDIGNQGVHEMDIAHWVLGQDGSPAHVVSSGGKYLYDDDQETPNTLLSAFDYGASGLVFEVRGLITEGDGGFEPNGGNTVGTLYYGAEGYAALSDDGFRVFRGEKHQLEKDVHAKLTSEQASVAHMDNFLKAVRSRKHTDLNADIEISVVSANLCHLANISYRTGRKLSLDRGWNVQHDAVASELYGCKYRAPWLISDKV
jgi:predicted dehydrogenase